MTIDPETGKRVFGPRGNEGPVLKGGAENGCWVGQARLGPSSTICPLPCPTGSPGDERHSRGCGNLPGCPGPTGFHNNHTFHFLRCCNTTKCNGGPGKGRGQRGAWDLGARGTQGHGRSLEGTDLLSGSLFLPLEGRHSKSFLKEGFCGNPMSLSNLRQDPQGTLPTSS